MSITTPVAAGNLADASPPPTNSGLVLVNYGKSVLVEDDAGCLYRCVARRNLRQIVSGDRVRWEAVGTQEGVIVAIEPRRTILQRGER